MIVNQVLLDGISERSFAEEDQSIQNFVFDTFHESFHIGIHVRASRRDLHGLNVDIGQDPAERLTETSIVIHDQMTLAIQESIFTIAASEIVLCAESLEDPLGRMTLLAGRLLIGFEDLGDDRKERFDLRLRTNLLLAVARGLFMLEDLHQRMPADVVMLHRRSLAHPFNQQPATDFRPKLHIYVQSGTSDDFQSYRTKVQ